MLEIENSYKKELAKAKETGLQVQKQNEELKLKFDTEITNFSKQKESDALQ